MWNIFSSFQAWQPEDRIYPCFILFMVIPSIHKDIKCFFQVDHILIAILVVTFLLNVVFRFFLVLHAEGFLWRGSFNLKLFKQLYWLLWAALVTLGLIPFAITPIMLGNFPTQNSYRKQLCLGVREYEKDEKEDNPSPFGTRIISVIIVFYILRFFKKIRSFVFGQCPEGKMCSIGKFRRNVLGLSATTFVALFLQCFFCALTFIRELTQDLDESKAFFVNFVVFDGLVYLLAFAVFIFARNHDIPTRKDAAKNVKFDVSKVQDVLQPRRPVYFNVPSQVDRLSLPIMMQRGKTARDNSDRLKLKTCDRFSIRRVSPNNEIDPIVTIYDSSVKVEVKLGEYQAKKKGYFKKESEMPQTISADSDFTENSNATLGFSSEMLQMPRVDTSEKVKSVQRFSYFTKD